MRISRAARKSLAVIAAVSASATIFFAVERPWFLRWGATPAEITAAMPGDERVPNAPLSSTRAITIDAPIEQVWPWLAQLGQDRGGFYSFEILEDLAGCEMPSATRILAEHQAWKPGDRLWMYPPDKLDGIGGAPLVSHVLGRHLVFATRQLSTRLDLPEDGTWGFYLRSAAPGVTRLVVRSRASGAMSPLWKAVHFGVFEPAHYVMERRMMTNLEAFAEGRLPWKAEDHVAVGLWVATVLLMIAAIVAVARRRSWLRPLAVVASTTLVFQLLTLTQPPPLLEVPLVAMLALGLWWKPGVRPKHWPEWSSPRSPLPKGA